MQRGIFGRDGVRQRGFSLMEVVIAIFVFAVGLLALASLQGALTRTMSDAKQRTEAASLAESVIEAQRGFTELVPSASGAFTYSDIVTLADPITVQGPDGTVYTLNQTVTDYYFDALTDAFVTTKPQGSVISEIKDIAITVTWTSGEFRGTESMDAADRDLGSGSITVRTSIAAMTPSNSLRIANVDADNDPRPMNMGYTPSQDPGVIALDLGLGKYKETLVPIPNVDASGFKETHLDVLTYAAVGSNFFLQRREEFVTVPCKCTLRAAAASNPGRRPMVWAGDEYAGGHELQKPYGEPTPDPQSKLCNACCRDHHDGGTSEKDHTRDDAYNRYSPFKGQDEHVGGRFENDHLHYAADGSVAGVGQEYLEACRMVRVDGFFQVTQDFRREDENAFPADFLDDATETATYSGYVTSAVSAYFEASSDGYSEDSTPPCIGESGCAAQPSMQAPYPATLGAGEFPSWTALPFNGNGFQQLSSRGIYIDYLSEDLRAYLDRCVIEGEIDPSCCIVDGSETEICGEDAFVLDQTESTNLLEIIPFFEVQQTAFDRWNEAPPDTPVETSNEEIEDESIHDRGEVYNNALGNSRVRARNHRGNLGFTNTQRVDPQFTANETEAALAVIAQDSGTADGGTPASATDPVVAGMITYDLPGNPPFRVTAQGGAYCERTPGGYECTVTTTVGNPTVTIFGYGAALPVQTCDPLVDLSCVLIPPTTRFACATGLVKQDESPFGAGDDTWARFKLGGKPTGSMYQIHVTEVNSDPCPGGGP